MAELYAVDTKMLNRTVKRNAERFPNAFRFQLTAEETDTLKFQIDTPGNIEFLRSQIVTLKDNRGKHSKYLSYVFTEHGVVMLSAV